jgi:hypothetical protein
VITCTDIPVVGEQYICGGVTPENVNAHSIDGLKSTGGSVINNAEYMY